MSLCFHCDTSPQSKKSAELKDGCSVPSATTQRAHEQAASTTIPVTAAPSVPQHSPLMPWLLRDRSVRTGLGKTWHVLEWCSVTAIIYLDPNSVADLKAVWTWFEIVSGMEMLLEGSSRKNILDDTFFLKIHAGFVAQCKACSCNPKCSDSKSGWCRTKSLSWLSRVS